MDLEEFIKDLQKLNEKVKQNKEKYTVKCDIEFIPKIEERIKPEDFYYTTKITSTNIIYTVLIEERF